MPAMTCGKTALVAQKGDKLKAVKFRCNSWHCDKCRPFKRKKIMAIGAKGHPNRMLTLTINPAFFDDFSESACALKQGFRRAVEQLMRYHGHTSIEYLCVFEQHKSGWPHLHVLIRSRFISQRWLSHYMERRGLGKIVDIRKIKGKAQAAYYVSKYMGKEPRRYDGCKRYWTSTKFVPKRPKVEKDPSVKWFIEPNGEAYCRHEGMDILDAFVSEGFTPWFSALDRLRRRTAASGEAA